MPYSYVAFGITIHSIVKLPALSINNNLDNDLISESVQVEIGIVPKSLNKNTYSANNYVTLNENELKFEVPGIAVYYVAFGKVVIIEPKSKNWDEILLYFYSNCLAAILFQRNLVPFHVSGVFNKKNEVFLFAGYSGIGKSTTALMLRQKGYAPFTDDTAILEYSKGNIYAIPSYPMVRLWQNTFEEQSLYSETDKQNIYADIEKYGFSFHDEFNGTRAKVAGIVFLEEADNQIEISNLKPMKCLQYLALNIYRGEWLEGMDKNRLRYNKLTELANHLPAWLATRPKDSPTFESFANAIDEQIIRFV